ncbi:MAG: hypothetical protein CSA70_04625 [Rhodobacterales bacterium]|nr:MAG: hypothetical protein CSA70_04625 [Rhodobacterales bacterium]
MMEDSSGETTAMVDLDGGAKDRLVMGVLGGVAGCALWLFIDVLPDRIENQRVLLVLGAFILGSFGVALALAAPPRYLRAALGGVGVSLIAALLLFWVSFRYENIEPFFESGYPVAAYFAILCISTPFVAAAFSRTGGWKKYELLFDTSWNIVVRYVAGVVFTGVFWLVLMLSNTLLKLVGINWIEDLIDVDGVPYVLSGVVLGLALSVVHELRDYVSPFLIHRLLRLLLPVLLGVVLVFVVALPLRGLSELFGDFSSAATLMSVGLASVTLISTVLARDDEEATKGWFMIQATRVLCILTAVIAGLAVYAVWIRVAQYGWTPDRMFAALAALFLFGYGVLYAVAVVLGQAWMARIRNINRNMAMAFVALAALLLTPLLDLERSSVANQIARFEAGLSKVENLPFWEMAHDWGVAGQAGLDHLASLKSHKDHAVIMTQIERTRTAGSRYMFQRDTMTKSELAQVKELREIIPVVPKEISLPEDAFEQLRPYEVSNILRGCKQQIRQAQKGCVILFGQFHAKVAERHGLLIYSDSMGQAQIEQFVLRDGKVYLRGRVEQPRGQERNLKSEEVIGAIHAGKFRLAPSSTKSLWVGDTELIPNN